MPHELFMQRCLQLARHGAGFTAPNPMVGSVIVHEGKIIGEGYHPRVGEHHAEINALESVRSEDRDKIKNSTLYVNLEPCSHHGRTPPCSTRIIEEGIPHVVIGAVDSSPEVGGKGVQMLQEAGVDVTVGVLEADCLELNKRFYTFHQEERPYVVLKWAQSRDGSIGQRGQQVYISHPITNRLVHRWRSEEAAIMVGYNTVRDDNPQLTNRLYYGPSPRRMFIDRHLNISPWANIFRTNVPAIVFNEQQDEEADRVSFIKVKLDNSFPEVFSKIMVERQLTSVLVEGGAQLLQSFIDWQLWDEIRVITNPNQVLNEGVTVPTFKGQLQHSTHVQSDEIAFFVPHG